MVAVKTTPSPEALALLYGTRTPDKDTADLSSEIDVDISDSEFGSFLDVETSGTCLQIERNDSSTAHTSWRLLDSGVCMCSWHDDPPRCGFLLRSRAKYKSRKTHSRLHGAGGHIRAKASPRPQ